MTTAKLVLWVGLCLIHLIFMFTLPVVWYAAFANILLSCFIGASLGKSIAMFIMKSMTDNFGSLKHLTI